MRHGNNFNRSHCQLPAATLSSAAPKSPPNREATNKFCALEKMHIGCEHRPPVYWKEISLPSRTALSIWMRNDSLRKQTGCAVSTCLFLSTLGGNKHTHPLFRARRLTVKLLLKECVAPCFGCVCVPGDG